jgi:S1-C subfamily serine protease
LAGADLHFDQVSRVLGSDAAATSGPDGRYRLEGAPTGPLTVRAHKDGFVVQLISGVRVDSGATRRQDIVLAALDGGQTFELGGIGGVLARAADGIALQNVFPGDPAARAGLRAGDVILSIDGDTTNGMSIADALQRIRGQPGTTVGLSVRRPETGDFLERTIVRATVVH